MENIFSNIGAVISLALGVMAILVPTKTESFVSIKSIGKEGVSEVRATYGGFFAGISLYALISQSPDAFVALGFGWLGAAFIRFITLFFGYYTTKNVAAVSFELVIGVLCISEIFI